MRSVFGDDLAPSDEINAWARVEVRRERALRSLASRYDADLSQVPRIAPKLATAMGSRTYQRSAARFAAEAGSFLLADEPGLGKTATILAALMESEQWHGPNLIIAPKVSLDAVWKRQVKMWTGASVVTMPDGAARREDAWEWFQILAKRKSPVFLAVNPAMIRRQYGNYCSKCRIWDDQIKKDAHSVPPEHFMERHKLKREIKSEDWPMILDHDWNSIILDESHELLASYTPSNLTQQIQGLLDLKAETRYALTGTPLNGHERKLWGTFAWLYPDMFKGYWGFIKEFFETEDFRFGIEIGGLKEERRKDFYKSVDRIMLRRTRTEVRPDLPIGKRNDILVDMTPTHEAQYREFEEMGETALRDGTVASQGVLSELTRLRQMAWGRWEDPKGDGHLMPTTDSPQLDLLLQMLHERGIFLRKQRKGKFVGEAGWLPEKGSAYKYVIVSQATEILQLIGRVLEEGGVKTMSITGAESMKKKNENMRRFQSDDTEVRVCLLNTQAGGVSIELDAWCDEMFILDESFIADDQVQVEGRINNRSGRVSPRTWHYIRVAGTVQQKIADGNWTQHDLQHKLLDGRRGVDLALHILGGGK